VRADVIRVQVIRAWPRRHASVMVDLAEGATVADAVSASGMDDGEHVAVAVFGERVEAAQVLREGDRVELLRPLTMDPKEARRRRALK
jgi:putative ubiquitin-RnfH superfamily antitoxin RatB of RatAB toxin-antitoxin module